MSSFPDPTYYDTYSDPEEDEKQPNGQSGAEDDQEEDEEEDDFVQRPERDASPGLIPYQPQAGTGESGKRKHLDGSDQVPASGDSSRNGLNEPMPPAKRKKPEPLEPSILNAEPLDEFVIEIADWIYKNVQGKQNIEVEAKVGRLIDTRTGERLNLPILNETILVQDYPDLRFESNMSLQQHAQFNQALNRLSERSNLPTHTGAKIKYAHTIVVDSFFASSGGNKIRVTTDAKTGEVKECVQKVRIANLNVFSPKRKLDWRVSVSTELPVPPPTGITLSSRRKDRLTYIHQSFKVDLTQVTASNSASTTSATPELLHELELEFADHNELMRFAQIRTRGGGGGSWSGKEGDMFDELVRVFVNNIRIMVRNAG